MPLVLKSGGRGAKKEAMAEKKMPLGSSVDPEAQKYIRDVTKDYVTEMIGVLVDIARNEKTGARDRMKSACRVIEYYSRGTSAGEEQGEGKGTTVVVVAAGPHGASVRDLDEASDELRRLTHLTQAGKA